MRVAETDLTLMEAPFPPSNLPPKKEEEEVNWFSR